MQPPLLQVSDPDDGYSRVPIGFNYEFNGTTYTNVYISVNGFITFDAPRNLPQNNPEALYLNNPTTFQPLVIAPYWGDHYYRNITDLPNGYQPGAIKYQTIQNVDGNGNRAFVVEWNNININYDDPQNPGNDVQSSVGNFQVWLYESTDPNSDQGTIEFAYGQIGPTNPQVTGQRVITTGASIGIKGSNGDFVNGLQFVPGGGIDPTVCSRSKTTPSYTDVWQPSGGSDRRIRLSANIIFRLEESWGDGDADLSKAPGGRHAQFFLQQNRYVTMNDVREILISIAQSKPLDSVRRRNAYHADVNHNGRYFWRNNPPGSNPARTRVEIPIRSEFYNEDLPNEITSLNQIFYFADEYDAAMIIQYMNAILPQLPWIYDWYDDRPDKLSAATTVKFGELNQRTANTVEVPVYLNNNHEGVLSLRLDFNGKVLGVTSTDGTVAEFHGKRVVLAGEGQFDSNEPIFTALVETEGDVTATEVNFNGNLVADLSNTEEAKDLAISATVSPNPVVESATFNVTIPQNGMYSLDVYDQNGSLIVNILDGELAADNHTFEWNGTDRNGNPIAQGLYIYRLSGNNGFTVTNTLIVGK